jgi:hypothetical protein
MVSKQVDGAPYAAAMRDADPRLRQPPAGPLRFSQPSRVDDIWASRFAAFRASTARTSAQRRSVPRQPPGRDSAAVAARIAAYRARIAADGAEAAESPAAEACHRAAASVRAQLGWRRRAGAAGVAAPGVSPGHSPGSPAR